MHPEWLSRGADYLLESQTKDGSWGVRPHANSMIEPTCYAALAFLSHAKTDSQTAVLDRTVCEQTALKAAQFLAAQQVDGHLTTVPIAAETSWITTLCLLIWSEFEDRFADQIDQACRWLLACRPHTYPVATKPAERILELDTTIAGWSWVQDTFSWLEPTVYAVLALKKCGLARQPRFAEGLRLIQDRQMDNGTWNFGNTTVFGSYYPSQPTATGLGLLAASLWSDKLNALNAQGCDYLETTLPTTRAAASLCWGLLGLEIWNRRPHEDESWLSESFEKSLKRSNSNLQVAYLLLATGELALPVLGLQRAPATYPLSTNEAYHD